MICLDPFVYINPNMTCTKANSINEKKNY
uniref:Uncharacterized protein n=1 Tax=Rhizophora mucronata TaxID=61149 RepID=A0A2P2NDM0_RHIMU